MRDEGRLRQLELRGICWVDLASETGSAGKQRSLALQITHPTA